MAYTSKRTESDGKKIRVHLRQFKYVFELNSRFLSFNKDAERRKLLWSKLFVGR